MAVPENVGNVIVVDFESEMRRSYIDFAMSVIVDRALPDVRDGMKPVQRRILFSMGELGLRPDRPHRKSAKIVGEVMGRYHPHGDQAIYDAMVRMAQKFSYRHPLVDGHGNFGSVDGDPPAHMRYTEARLSGLGMEMLRDIDRDTVHFVPNFDESMEQPSVLPSRFPNLLVNGATGIAVGMSTSIPPHNLGEVVDAIVHLIDHPDAELDALLRYIKGPDFPTGALILGRDGLREAYATGRGGIKVRAKVQIDQTSTGKPVIVVTEIPYMVNKAGLIEKIADLHREKRIEGITELRDESDRHGMRIVMELRKDTNPHILLNQLYKHTQLQVTFGAIMLALVDNEPRILPLRDLLRLYVEYQREVITRRTQFDLRKAEERAHILEGLRIALDHLDEIIQLIRNAPAERQAKEELMSRFALSERQAVAILDMQLRRLTGLERDKIENEYQELLKTIARLQGILGDVSKVYAIVKEEMQEIRQRFDDPRRTQIVAAEADPEELDLIPEEDIVVTLTHQGYIKRLPLSAYKEQRRGGRGVTALNIREEDFVEHLFITTTHTFILFFTNRGRVFRLKAHEIPEATRTARGMAIVNLIQIEREEQITAAIPVTAYDDVHYLMMATRNGTVKKTALAEFDSPRAGLIAIALDEDDELVGVHLSDGRSEILLVTQHGQAIRFPETQVRPMGRTAHGVKGISLEAGDRVVGMDCVVPGADLLVVTERGYGKRTPLEEYRVTRRGGKGIRTLHRTEKNGPIVGARVVDADDQLMLLNADGVMIRISVRDVSQLGRSTQGVRLMRLAQGTLVVAIAQIAAKDEVDGE